LKDALDLETETALLERYLRRGGDDELSDAELRFEGFSREAVISCR
jgi:hypothetical protein